MPQREPTLGEVADDVHKLEEAIRELTNVMRQTYVRKDVYDVAQAAMERRVKAVEDGTKWAVRAAITGVLFPIIAAIIAAIVLTLGGLS